MNKTKLVPFNIELAKAGARVVTRWGYPVRIGFYDVKNEAYPILALVQDGEYELPYSFTKNGKYHRKENIDSSFDLFIEEEVEEDDSDYDPYKATVESIADMVERYSELQSIEELKDFYNNVRVKCQDAFDYGKVHMINQDEEPADNKPKFKKGDWVVFHPGCNAHQIIRVVENATSHTYGYDTVDNYYFNDTTEGVRLWNINDAKNGDVLACYDCIVLFKEIDGLNIKCHCAYHYMNTPMFFVDTLQNKSAFYPATEEECDILSKKIKEEGYELNPIKKKLEKVEKEVQKRLMTYQELAWWLRRNPEEFREWKFRDCDGVNTDLGYNESKAHQPAKYILIRKNGGEWQEPLIEI